MEIGQEALEGGYFSSHYFVDSPEPRVRRFVQAYQARYGQLPDGLAASGYDAAGILFEAMKKAPTLEPSKIRDQLAQVKDFPGVTGVITIDADRNARKSAVILRIQKGRLTYVTTLDPE